MECTKCAFIKLNKISNQSKGIMKKEWQTRGTTTFLYTFSEQKKFSLDDFNYDPILFDNLRGLRFNFQRKKCGPLIRWQHV